MAATKREKPQPAGTAARLDRLAGSGKGWGGGLPLPLLFAAVLNELLDNGAATHRRLTEIAADVLCFKSRQVMSTWPSWEAFIDDVLAQMAAQDILATDGHIWTPGPGLVTGTYIEVIPAHTWKGRKRPSDGVTVWDKGERERQDTHAEHEATSLVGHFRDAEPEHVSEIRQSVGEVGPLYPVLVDQHGRILDGGHRKAADPNWPEKRIEVQSEQEALAIGLWANRGKPLPPKVQARITELIGELTGTNQRKRERITAALLANPSRSTRDIAREVGCDDKTVAAVKRELVETAEIPHFAAKGGRGITTGTPAPPPPRPVVVNVTERTRESPERVRVAVVKPTGESADTPEREPPAAALDALLAALDDAHDLRTMLPLPADLAQPVREWARWRLIAHIEWMQGLADDLAAS